MIGVAPGANAHLTPEDIDALPEQSLRAGRGLPRQPGGPRSRRSFEACERARARGMTTVLNPAPIDPAILEPRGPRPDRRPDAQLDEARHWRWRGVGLDQVDLAGGRSSAVARAGFAARGLERGDRHLGRARAAWSPREDGCLPVAAPAVDGRRYGRGRRRLQRGPGGGPGRGPAAGRCRGLGLRRGGAGRHPAGRPGCLAPPRRRSTGWRPASHRPRRAIDRIRRLTQPDEGRLPMLQRPGSFAVLDPARGVRAGGPGRPEPAVGSRPAERAAAQDAVGGPGPARDGRDQPAAGHGRRDPRASSKGATRSTPRSPPTRCSASSSRCRAASAATCSPSSGTRRRKKLYGLNASGRAPYAATLELFAPRGLTEIPDARAPELVGPRLRRRLGPAPPAVRHEAAGRAARAGDRLRRGGLPRQRDHRRRLAGAGPELAQDPDLGRLLPARRPRARGRRRSSATPTSPGRSARSPRDGRDAFYRGPIADAIVAYSQAGRRPVQRKDFEDHTSTWVEPVSTNYRGYDVWELPPNGQGIAVLQMLNLLEPYDLKAHGPAVGRGAPPDDRGQEAGLRGPGQVLRRPRVQPRSPSRELISKAYAAERRAADRSRPGQRPARPPASRGEADTIYMTVVDKDFNAVSLIQSNFYGLRLGPRPRRPRLPAPEPRLPLRARPAPRQPARAAQAAVPHDHPRLRHQGRQALAQLRPDGGRHAGPGARAGALQHDRLRHGRAGGRRRPPVPPLRLVRADRPAAPRTAARSPSSRRSAPTSARPSRPRGTGSPTRAAASAATRRSGSTLERGVLIGGSDPRKDGAAMGY